MEQSCAQSFRVVSLKYRQIKGTNMSILDLFAPSVPLSWCDFPLIMCRPSTKDLIGAGAISV